MNKKKAVMLLLMLVAGMAIANTEESLMDISLPSTPLGSDTGLLLWNRLGSTNEVRNSEVGPNGTLNAGRFVDSPFGKGIELNMQEQMGVTFPPQIVPAPNGCIEFWAKLSGFPTAITQPGGQWPGLVTLLLPNGATTISFCFSNNDGYSNGGLVHGLSGYAVSGTGRFGSWTYASALKTNTVSDWHHYALVWSRAGIPGVGKVVSYVDGRLNTGHSLDNYGTPFAGQTNGTFGLLTHHGVPAGSVAFDNIKIWNFAKTNFSDRLDEDAGDLRRVLSVSNAHGDAVPANGDHTYTNGELVVAGAPSVVMDGDARYVCTGVVVGGNAFTQTGPTNVTLTLTNNATLAWQWSTNYFLSLTSMNGSILNTAEGWKPAHSNYSLSVQADPGYTFDHWEMDGLPIGSGVPLSLIMDQAHSVIAVFRSLFMDVSANAYWNVAWMFNPRKGYFIGTLTLTNTNAFKVLTAPFWFQVESTTNHWLRYPTGINANTGIPYLDITAAVTNQLPGIGNGDLMLDKGESVTVTGIELMGRRAPDGVVVAVWADPPGMLAKPVDSDGDGMPDVDEYIAGTSAVDPDSFFRIRLGPDGRSVQWDGKPNRVYTVLTSTNLSQGFVIEQDNIKSTGKPMTHQTVQRISDPGTSETRFYRVNVILK